MKNVLGIILMALLISCKSDSKTDKEGPEKENGRLRSEWKLAEKEKNPNAKNVDTAPLGEVANPTAYTFDDFRISKNRVGIFSKGMSISDVYNTLPRDQIKKKVGYGEFAGDTYDDYEIYDANGKKILVLTAMEKGNTHSKIGRVLILDKRFETAEKIGLGSTFGDLERYYATDKMSPDIEHIVIDVEPINAWFTIGKTELREGWWNGRGIDRSKIPGTAKFDGICIWWK
ncbi:hypothetical protein [Pseudozobellia thermophila]|uniref:Uncharacterized protein n=1 Tax=Pseudozobellia thermophila TaxID=192903 RepID=A0A1M6P090_9FLAO|nr:hypothetical protein [Pseudozobellia thermophila]SHK01336.1 hypothetical protein SAMN04488513_11710 [Pseudozobellia thermophila]